VAAFALYIEKIKKFVRKMKGFVRNTLSFLKMCAVK